MRLAGDRYVLVEYGPMELDLNLRVRVWALQQYLTDKQARVRPIPTEQLALQASVRHSRHVKSVRTGPRGWLRCTTEAEIRTTIGWPQVVSHRAHGACL